MVKAIPYLFKKIYHASLWDHRRKSILFSLISRLFFITIFLTLSCANLFGQVVIKEKIVLENTDTLWYSYKPQIKKLLKTENLFSGIIPDFTGKIALQFAYADQIYGTLSPDSKVIIETKDTLIEHNILPGFDRVKVYNDASVAGDCPALTTLSYYYSNYGFDNPDYATLEFNVKKGDSVKIAYETYVHASGQTEQIPIVFSWPGFSWQWILKDGIWVKEKTADYTYLNYAKYYECLFLKWRTVLDIYAFEYPEDEDSVDHFKIEIKPDSLTNGIKVAEKDTVAFTELATLFIKAMDADSNATELDSTKLLRFEITTNTKYGTFIKSNGDTLLTQPSVPVVLENITYADAKNGKVKFAAVKANPKSIVKCRIKVTLQDDATTKGEKEAVVLEQTLKIVMEEPYEIWPTYFNKYGQRVIPEDSSKNVFSIMMTRGSEPVRQHPFRLTTNYMDMTGGHEHTNERTENDINFGYFMKQDNNTHYRPFEEKTNSIGLFTDIAYVASQYGDLMQIYLHSKENQLLKDTVTISERIPDFVELGAGNSFILVGAPENHSGTNDPCRSTPPTSEHNNNHFGTDELVHAIKNIANNYNALHPGVSLRINDMSLEHGGLFDVYNNWNTPHRSHRTGQNADIGFTGIDNNGKCVDVDISDLDKIITRHSSKRPLKEGDHFHIYVY